MEIKIGDIKLTAEDAGRRPSIGDKRQTYIYIDVLGDFNQTVKPKPKVLASDLKAAIAALEQACIRV